MSPALPKDNLKEGLGEKKVVMIKNNLRKEGRGER